jgi:hypothetical protein
MAQVVEGLPGKNKILSLNPTTTKSMYFELSYNEKSQDSKGQIAF